MLRQYNIQSLNLNTIYAIYKKLITCETKQHKVTKKKRLYATNRRRRRKISLCLYVRKLNHNNTL